MAPTSKLKIILVGGGGHCAACIDVIELEGRFEIVGIIDNDAKLESVCGYPVLGGDSALSTLISDVDHALVTVGQIREINARKRLVGLLTNLKYKLPTITSPRAYVSKHASVGTGTIIMHDAIVNSRATIGQHCIINSKALIEHDAVVEHYSHVSTGAIVNGGAVIRQESFVGSHATVVENAVSGRGEFIKAGTVFKGAENG